MNIEQLKIVTKDSDDIKSSIVIELIDRLQAAESKLEEMNKVEPVGYVRMDSFTENRIYDKYQIDPSWTVAKVFLDHPQVQSNADKEIEHFGYYFWDPDAENGYEDGFVVYDTHDPATGIKDHRGHIWKSYKVYRNVAQ